MKKQIWFILILLIICSCKNKEQKELYNTFSQAGSNKKELKEVIDHYSEPKDSLKKKAAIFLIKNMYVHYSLENKDLNHFNRIFDIYDSMLIRQTNYQSINLFTSIVDSVEKIDGFVQQPQKNPDSQNVSAEYLIQNIDYAFKAWQNNPWSKDFDFNCFCEYILPYQISMERMENWRPAFYDILTEIAYKTSNPMNTEFVYDVLQEELSKYVKFNLKFEQKYPFIAGISNTQKGGMGSCFQTAIYRTMALRSAGLPVTIDYTPYWGNYGGNHSQIRLVSNKKSDILFTNENIQDNINYYFRGVSLFTEKRPTIYPSDFPENVTVIFKRLIPKIYRYTWSVQPERLYIAKNALPGEITPGFRLYEKDITKNYVVCGNTTIHFDCDLSKHKIAYLTVFNNKKWSPVSSTVINSKGDATFSNMGVMIVYMPALCKNGNIISTGEPFYFDKNGSIVNVTASKQKVQNIKIISKYPFFANIAYHTFKMKGGVFEGANKLDFSDAESLYKIDNLPYYYQEVSIKNSKLYKYIRFKAARNQKCSLAELKFFGICNNDTIPLKGFYFNEKETDTPALLKIADNNLETYYENEFGSKNWVGFDLGKGNKKRIVKIEFCPRNDANCIIPGNEYELFFWNKKWVSLGRQKAYKRYLIFNNIPVGALLWLKCHTEGKEERIFLYEKNKQVWF